MSAKKIIVGIVLACASIAAFCQWLPGPANAIAGFFTTLSATGTATLQIMEHGRRAAFQPLPISPEQRLPEPEISPMRQRQGERFNQLSNLLLGMPHQVKAVNLPLSTTPVRNRILLAF